MMQKEGKRAKLGSGSKWAACSHNAAACNACSKMQGSSNSIQAASSPAYNAATACKEAAKQQGRAQHNQTEPELPDEENSPEAEQSSPGSIAQSDEIAYNSQFRTNFATLPKGKLKRKGRARKSQKEVQKTHEWIF